MCNNCLYKQHQCYACGELGYSDENFSQQVLYACTISQVMWILGEFSCIVYLKYIQPFPALKVFPCSASNCGHFYHPKCVARLLCANDQIKSEELQAKIAARDYFACPLHICKVCNISEDKNQYASNFAICRRCPTAYHRKCLPR